MEGLSVVAAVLGSLGVAVGFLVFVAIARQFRYIARPNTAIIVSGTSGGYKIVTEGRAVWRVPVFEQIAYMDTRLIPIDVVVQNAYSAGNIPLHIHAIANVKINCDPRFIGNAVERFLGRNTDEIRLVAQQTLEGALREVLAQLTPEEVNEDRLKFAQTLINAAGNDLYKLGIQLDTLKIQHVADDTGYLDSLGRPRIAAALRDAENGENQAMQETTQAQAFATQRAEVAKATAETAILSKRNDLRRIKAELDGNAHSVELEAAVAAQTARAEAERQLQGVRNELEQRRLEAEVVIPAEIQQHAQAIIAKGDAAPVIENGIAAVEVLRLMADSWDAMGPAAKELYVIQHLDTIVGAVATKMKDIQVDNVTILDQGDGEALGSYAASYPLMIASVMRALKDTTGVDVPSILNRESTSNPRRSVPPPPPPPAPANPQFGGVR